jgi:hypothetical protein
MVQRVMVKNINARKGKDFKIYFDFKNKNFLTKRLLLFIFKEMTPLFTIHLALACSYPSKRFIKISYIKYG